MNWGYKIATAIAVFIIIMLSMVYVAFKQTNEMIDTNYYQKELKYQSYIDASKNLDRISTDTILRVNESSIGVQLPKVLVEHFMKGTLEFLKNDDQRNDVLIAFSPDSNGMYLLDKTKFALGTYMARIQWNSDNKTYYREQTIIIR